MPSDPYTHDFKFEIDGSFIRGEAEFNTDGKASFRISEWSQPLSLDVLKAFCNAMDWTKKTFETNGEIKKLIIKEKE